jgi:hypothetical protein
VTTILIKTAAPLGGCVAGRLIVLRVDWTLRVAVTFVHAGLVAEPVLADAAVRSRKVPGHAAECVLVARRFARRSVGRGVDRAFAKVAVLVDAIDARGRGVCPARPGVVIRPPASIIVGVTRVTVARRGASAARAGTRAETHAKTRDRRREEDVPKSKRVSTAKKICAARALFKTLHLTTISKMEIAWL